MREIYKRLMQTIKAVFIGFHVIGIDIRNHSERWGQVQERGVRLIRLGDQKFASAQTRV